MASETGGTTIPQPLSVYIDNNPTVTVNGGTTPITISGGTNGLSVKLLSDSASGGIPVKSSVSFSSAISVKPADTFKIESSSELTPVYIKDVTGPAIIDTSSPLNVFIKNFPEPIKQEEDETSFRTMCTNIPEQIKQENKDTSFRTMCTNIPEQLKQEKDSTSFRMMCTNIPEQIKQEVSSTSFRTMCTNIPEKLKQENKDTSFSVHTTKPVKVTNYATSEDVALEMAMRLFANCPFDMFKGSYSSYYKSVRQHAADSVYRAQVFASAASSLIDKVNKTP